MLSGLRRAAGYVLMTLLTALSSVCLAEQVLIAHPSAAIDSLSVNGTRLIFSMQVNSWPDGSAVRVFVLPDDHPAHRDFSKELLGLYPRQLRRVWDRQLYSGAGQSPELVSDAEAMRKAVAGTPGAIGYLPREQIDESVRELQLQN
ncbi:MAG: hypothetical protein KDI82_02135 [Gammaproteobacteria bacterium]|nr:hypothetical protein [Gammaproteobacteria bacterium]